jgi:alkylated DNA repair dioxygenase AlkB
MTPITYIPDFLPNHEELFNSLWNGLAWVNVAGPRIEYYVNDFGVPYTYGTPPYARTYDAQPDHPAIAEIREKLSKHTWTKYEVCFLNGYRDGKDQLGWHSDDSPEMDDARPIGIVSLGAAREIWFREIPKGDVKPEVHKITLASGSLCLMHAGMQDTHQHRIPKSPLNKCPPRVSLTFRGYVK